MKAYVRSEAFRGVMPGVRDSGEGGALGRARTTVHVRLRGSLLLVRALDEQGGLPEAHEGVLADRGLDMLEGGGEALRGAHARARRTRADRRGRDLVPQGMQVHGGHCIQSSPNRQKGVVPLFRTVLARLQGARLCLYAKGLIEPSERLILFVLYHSM